MSVYSVLEYIKKRGLALASSVTFTGTTTVKAPIVTNTATPVNVTGAITAAQLAGGLITSTSAAAVTATLPTAELLGVALGAVQGTVFKFIVDNTAGANIVTMQVNTGIVAAKQVGTTDAADDILLTVAVGAIAAFEVVFSSATAAKLFRVG
jgi:hypothetical protein